MRKVSVVVSTLLLTLALPVFAQSASTPRIDARAENQQRRIDNGVKDGSLTPREAANAQRRENKLKGDVAAAKADGKVTPQERKRLRAEENRNSRKIYRKRHNAAKQ